jgi:putative ABC transport system substrate-binding protein
MIPRHDSFGEAPDMLDIHSVTDRARAFRQGLKETGYVEGENVAIKYRWAEGQFDRLPALAGRIGSPAGHRDCCDRSRRTGIGGQAAITTIPIVFGVPEDPVRFGLVARQDGMRGYRAAL